MRLVDPTAAMDPKAEYGAARFRKAEPVRVCLTHAFRMGLYSINRSHHTQRRSCMPELSLWPEIIRSEIQKQVLTFSGEFYIIN